MNRLAKWLQKTGTSQEALASAVGVSQSYVSRLVSGARSPGRSVAIAIAKFTRGAVTAESWDEPARPLHPRHA